NIPEEYLLTGILIKLLISENSIIFGTLRAISRYVMPRIEPLRKMFSRPVKSGRKPAPNSITADRRPLSVIVPSLGAVIRDKSFTRVVFPEPLGPTMPSASPRWTAKLTSLSAQNACRRRGVRNNFLLWHRLLDGSR